MLPVRISYTRPRLSRWLVGAALAACCCLLPGRAAAQLLINEIVQSDLGSLTDEWNQFPDSWVELYNPSDKAVRISGYRLGKKSNPNKAWPLPDRTIPAHGHLIVYCDKEAHDWHTDFRLESDKSGAVYLFNGEEVIDCFKSIPPQLAPGIAYGRRTDGAQEIGFLLRPTPRTANCGEIDNAILPAPQFSVKGGVWTSPTSIELALTLPAGHEAAEIRYTLDGSEPTEDAIRYTAPLNFDTTTVVRARTFQEGRNASQSVTESYILHPRELTMPVISLVIDPKYLYDDKIGIWVDGTYDPNYPNWKWKWRRPLTLEYFEEDGKGSLLNQLCEIRMAGSRGARDWNTFRPFVVYANKRFGKPYFKHEFFPEDKPGITDFKSLFLRNSGNDCGLLHFRDALMQRSAARHVDLDWQGYRPVITYLNGQYYGLLNIRERSSSANIYANYNHLEDIDLISDWWELDEGTMDEFNRFVTFYTEGNHTLQQWEKEMDVEEFMNLMIPNLYYSNIDFPKHNIRQWRERREGARWRWVCYDMDVGMGLFWNDVAFPVHDWMYNTQMYSTWIDQSKGTLLWRKLMENDEAREMWIDRFAVYMGDFLNSRSVEPLMDEMFDAIDVEFRATAEVQDFDYDKHVAEREAIKSWQRGRTPALYQDISNHFGIGQPQPLIIDASETGATFKVQGITVSTSLFDGKWFEGRELNIDIDDTALHHWLIELTAPDGSISYAEQPAGSLAFTMPACQQLRITARTSHETAIRPTVTTPVAVGIYDLAGRRVSPAAAKRGIYVQNGKKVWRQ